MFRDHPSRAGVRLCAHILPLFLAFLVPACLVDLDQRCGEHQHYDANQAYCSCDDGYALVGTSCVACGDNEVSSSNGCVCADGYARETADAACTEVQDAARPCKSSADCPVDYSCSARTGLCEAPPDGLGLACTSTDDCAGHTASYCETVVAHSCVVNDCAPDPDKCYGDWVCCDIGLLTQSLCVPPEQLENGNCPAGGTLVPRKD